MDSTVQFYLRIRALLQEHHRVLDLGAGRGASHFEDQNEYRRSLQIFRGQCAEIIGCDVDPVVLENPTVDRAFLIGEDGHLNLEDESIDIVFCDWVFEHIEQPSSFSAELNRILKPGGWVCARTPNKYGYISLAARLIPDTLHERVLKVVQPKRKSNDVFPTHYRLNTRRAVNQCFPSEKWLNCSYTWNSEPAYFGSSVLAWIFAKTLQNLLPKSMATTLMLFVQKRQFSG